MHGIDIRHGPAFQLENNVATTEPGPLGWGSRFDANYLDATFRHELVASRERARDRT